MSSVLIYLYIIVYICVCLYKSIVFECKYGLLCSLCFSFLNQEHIGDVKEKGGEFVRLFFFFSFVSS